MQQNYQVPMLTYQLMEELGMPAKIAIALEGVDQPNVETEIKSGYYFAFQFKKISPLFKNSILTRLIRIL